MQLELKMIDIRPTPRAAPTPSQTCNSCPVQVVGSVVLILGLWVVVDKYNFLRVTKLDAIIKVTLQ